jgi:hypothetical protein
MNRILAKFLVATVALVTTAGLSSAKAGSYTWNAARTGNWNTGSNWIGDVAPSNTGGEDLIFGSAVGTPSGKTATNNIASDYPVNSVTFSGTTAYTLAGNSLLMNGNITNATTRPQTIQINITTGSSAVTMTSGTGSSSMLLLSGIVTNTSGLNLASGRFSFTKAIAGGSNVTTGANADVLFQASSSGGIANLTSGGRLRLGNNNGSGVMILETGPVEFLSSSSTVLKVGADAGGNIDPGVTYDQVSADGPGTFGGELSMDFGQMAIDPESLVSFTTKWQLFNASSYAGNFSSMKVTGAPDAYANMNVSWTLENGAWVSPIINNSAGNQYFAFDQATGQLIVVPEPSTIVFAALGATISGVHCINKRRRGNRAIAG